MGGYYPEGVTGNEPQIAGYPEREVERSCGAEEVEFMALSKDGQAALRNWQRDMEALIDASTEPSRIAVSNVLRRIRDLAADTMTVVVEECPFEGDVMQYLVGNEWVWECPVCGTEHEEEND